MKDKGVPQDHIIDISCYFVFTIPFSATGCASSLVSVYSTK